MKKVYKSISCISLVALLVLTSVMIFKRENIQDGTNSSMADETISIDETEDISNLEMAEDIVTFELVDFKQGEEYQLRGHLKGTSLDLLKAMLPSHDELVENSEIIASAGSKFYMSDEVLIAGEKFIPTYEFLYDELVEVKLVYNSEVTDENLFDSYVAELQRIFGSENEKSENVQTGEVIYCWKTDKSMLQLHSYVANGRMKTLAFSVGCTENERNLIIKENNKEPRELLLTEFKRGSEYQFGEIPWNFSTEEVSASLQCTLKDVTKIAPEKDYLFYDFADVVYVLEGNEAKTSVEFRADKLVYISFAFNELENPKEFFDKIILACQEQYGPESQISENTTGYISYRWRTEASQLAVGFDGIEVTIFLASIK